MKPKRVNPCVYAGLMGPAMWLYPQTAFAQTAGQDLDPQTMLVPFAAGLGCGIALAGTVSAIAWHRSKKQLEEESIARAEDAWFGTEDSPSYVPQHLRAPGEEAHPFLEAEEEDDPGRTLELDREEEKPERVETEGPKLRSVPTIPAVPQEDDKPKPPTPTSPHRVSPSETASVSTTMTGGFPRQTAESMPYSSIASRVPDIAASASPDETTVFLQEVQKKEASRKGAREAQPGIAAHEAEDYGDIAENYVQRLTWAERMSQRARGVRSVLSERLAKDSMDDLPVITRADGTVGDVGTDWWEREHGKDISRDLTIPVSDDYSIVQPAIDDVPFAASVTASQRSFAAEDIAAAARPHHDRSEISSRIAQIDSGLYPEEEKDGEDKDAMWKAALDALAENDTTAPDAGFTPVVAAPAGLDDDEVFDEPTASLAPQVPDAPAPIDTESYVDYLISDEMSKNPSYARTSRDYLKVIEGGSQKKESAAKAKKRGTKLKHLKPRGNRGRSANEA
ncbi:MAG: hypothetical protein ACI361_05965 [Atopobiaceae bacterium]